MLSSLGSDRFVEFSSRLHTLLGVFHTHHIEKGKTGINLQFLARERRSWQISTKYEKMLLEEIALFSKSLAFSV